MLKINKKGIFIRGIVPFLAIAIISIPIINTIAKTIFAFAADATPVIPTYHLEVSNYVKNSQKNVTASYDYTPSGTPTIKYYLDNENIANHIVQATAGSFQIEYTFIESKNFNDNSDHDVKVSVTDDEGGADYIGTLHIGEKTNQLVSEVTLSFNTNTTTCTISPAPTAIAKLSGGLGSRIFTIPEWNYTQRVNKPCTFLGWALQSNGEGEKYKNGDSFVMPSGTNSAILYAIWQDPTAVADNTSNNNSNDTSTKTTATKKYTFEEGELAFDDDENLIIEGSGDLDKFVALYINDKVVDKSNYTLASDSTIITLKSNYLDTLENGEYAIAMEWQDGRADGILTVNNGKYSIENVKTEAEEEKEEENIEVPKTSGITPDTGVITNSNEGITGNTPFIIIVTILLSSGITFMIHRNSKKVSFTKH
ncbi:hypothetical protein IKF28_00195 [Candidatus Saccharibacteria bacterium]|nr:hypothetical protein [Candidatus Saccharibacteria bacterium]